MVGDKLPLDLESAVFDVPGAGGWLQHARDHQVPVLEHDDPQSAARYACVNLGEPYFPEQLAGQAVGIDMDIGDALRTLCGRS